MPLLKTPTGKFLCQNLLRRLHAAVYSEYIIEGKVLEVGCGEHPIRNVSCPTDADTTIRNPDVQFANVLDLPFGDKEFDLVVTRNFIGCFDCVGRPDLKQKAIEEMRRVGKAVFVREYNRHLCPHYWLERLKRLLRLHY